MEPTVLCEPVKGSVFEIPDVLGEGQGKGMDKAGLGVGVRVICQDKLCDPSLGTAGDNPAYWNRKKTPADKLSLNHCTDISVNQFNVSLIQSFSDAEREWIL